MHGEPRRKPKPAWLAARLLKHTPADVFGGEDLSAGRAHQAHPLARYLLVLLHPTAHQSVHYQRAMKTC